MAAQEAASATPRNGSPEPHWQGLRGHLGTGLAQAPWPRLVDNRVRGRRARPLGAAAAAAAALQRQVLHGRGEPRDAQRRDGNVSSPSLASCTAAPATPPAARTAAACLHSLTTQCTQAAAAMDASAQPSSARGAAASHVVTERVQPGQVGLGHVGRHQHCCRCCICRVPENSMTVARETATSEFQANGRVPRRTMAAARRRCPPFGRGHDGRDERVASTRTGAKFYLEHVV